MTPQYIEIDEDGDKYYYSDKEMKIRHRENGPAIEWQSGCKFWYFNGKLHCEDGPAIEWADGGKRWFLNGAEFSEEAFNKKMNHAKTININGREFTIDELNSLIATTKS